MGIKTHHSPAVILVESEDPRNVGFVARAMKCHNLTDLRLVHSTWKEIPDPARITGTAALEQLDNARIFPTLSEAMADLTVSVAFSRRHFDYVAREYWLRELPEFLRPFGSIGLVFGRESQGLYQGEINQCSAICGIPVSGTMSYNLGQAVAIALYEVCGRMGEIDRPVPEPDQPASLAQIEALMNLWAKQGGEAYNLDQNRMKLIRAMLLRAQPREQELKSLFGLVKSALDE